MPPSLLRTVARKRCASKYPEHEEAVYSRNERGSQIKGAFCWASPPGRPLKDLPVFSLRVRVGLKSSRVESGPGPKPDNNSAARSTTRCRRLTTSCTPVRGDGVHLCAPTGIVNC